MAKLCYKFPHCQGTSPFTPTHHPAIPSCISPSCKHPVLPPDTTQLISPRPYFQQPTSLSHLPNSHQTLHTSCTAHKRRCSLPPSHFTFCLPCHGWLWTWKCKWWRWLNFCIPAKFKWYAVPQVGLGAFALNNFILRNLLHWWRSSSTVLLTAGTLLPGMSCPCVPGIDTLIWTVGQWAGFALFLDAVCAFLCYKTMFIVWGFATLHVAFCNNFDFCIVLNPL